MRSSFRLVSPIAFVFAAAALGACVNPEVEAKQWDELQTVTTTVNDTKAYVSELEALVDSLHRIVLKQDTAIRLLVDFTGAQVPSYRTQ